ncbi:MAG: hypothetical protein RIC55_36340 [Pirellulaceae bacterium]
MTRKAVWPVTTGVPFPRGALTSAGHCLLKDDLGRARAFDARATATWDAEATSVRWLTIDFLAEPGRTYHLEFGPAVRQRLWRKAEVNKDQGKVLVDTGPLRVVFSSNGPSALETAAIDLDKNGEFTDDEIVARGASDGDHYYVDHEGRRFSSAGDGDERKIVVEEHGHVRTCVRVDGFYTGPGGERIVAYRTRYHFFAGLPLVKAIDEFRIFGSTKGTRFQDVGVALDLNLDAEGRTVAADASGEAGNQVAAIPWRETTKSVSSYQSTYRHVGNPEYEAAVVEVGTQGARRASESPRIGEWMQVRDRRAAVTGSLRWMWQQFPKEWEATEDRLTLHTWSPRGGELDFGSEGILQFLGEAGEKYLHNWDGVRGTLSPISNYFYFAGREALDRGDADGRGTRKHHEFWLHFAAAAEADAGAEYGALAADQPLALASAQWNCDSGVFGPLAARPNDLKYERIVDRLFDLGRDAQDAFGDYGWWQFGSGPHYSYQWDEKTQRHYADPRRFEYHTYQKETQLWWNYLRSGERKFYDWAIPSENHWVDISVSHEPLKYRTRWLGGFEREQEMHFPRGDWSIDSPYFYIRHHDNGEAWLRGGSQYWASYHRTLETTTLAYYLTGDERYNDVVEYWREYFGDLAGKTNASTDMQAWHREQAWFTPQQPGQPPKTWATMIRDYAPFTSGSRHQQTLFFNLATLYEHTWDPVVRQALGDYADAFLEPDGPIGAWRSQENRLPAYADAPKLSHYWSTALWKYARASGDPRMKDVLARYYQRMWLADPFREDVGVYSNQQIGWAYYHTRDPRHLRPALLELEALLPNAEPLEKPGDLGRRIYNPYAPIQCYSAVPRLEWALEQAKRDGVAIPPPPPLLPQRTAIALLKAEGRPLQATLWGYDVRVRLLAADGRPFDGFTVKTTKAASDLQPFDRDLPQFEVYLHELTIPAEAPSGYYVLAPTLEMAVLEASGDAAVLCNAARPVMLAPGEACRLRRPQGALQLRLQSAGVASLGVSSAEGAPLAGEADKGALVVPLAKDIEVLRIENRGDRPLWFRLSGLAPHDAWVTFQTDLPASSPASSPAAKPTLAALPPDLELERDALYVDGRFGQGVLVSDGQSLHLPDHVTIDGQERRLFDLRQGTIEFWIKRLTDDRLQAARPATYLDNGLMKAWSPWKLPLAEWAHVAVVWRPLRRDPEQVVVHVYVNGLDRASYRSTHWEGYSRRPFGLPKNGPWKREFISAAPAGVAFAIDELRISSTPRYADLEVEFGGSQTYNPYRFGPPDKRPELDASTLLLWRFDGSLDGRSTVTNKPLSGEVK